MNNFAVFNLFPAVVYLDKILLIKLIQNILLSLLHKGAMSSTAYTIKNNILNAEHNAFPNMALIYHSHLLSTRFLRLHHSKWYTSWNSFEVNYLFLCFIHRTQNTLYPFDFISYFLKLYIFPQDYIQVLPSTCSFSIFSI